MEQAARQRQDDQIRSVKTARNIEDSDSASYQVTLSHAARQFAAQETERVYAKPDSSSVGNKPVEEQRFERIQQEYHTENANRQSALSVTRALESYAKTAAIIPVTSELP